MTITHCHTDYSSVCVVTRCRLCNNEDRIFLTNYYTQHPQRWRKGSI